MKIVTEQIDVIEHEKAAFRKVAESFWAKKGDELTVMGDFLGRIPAIKLLNPQPGEKILDAGCGNGFIARRLVQRGAHVWGCDRDELMLSRAIETENSQPLGIQYGLADITQLPYADNSFQAIACIAVLIMSTPSECRQFLAEAWRKLAIGGRLVVSIMHPYLYQANSPNRKGKSSWGHYKPLDNLPMNQSQRFREVYRNNKGEISDCPVWYHPEDFIWQSILEAGFIPIHSQSKFVTQEALNGCRATGPVGYPAFWQVLAKKY